MKSRQERIDDLVATKKFTVPQAEVFVDRIMEDEKNPLFQIQEPWDKRYIYA